MQLWHHPTLYRNDISHHLELIVSSYLHEGQYISTVPYFNLIQNADLFHNISAQPVARIEKWTTI